MSLRAAAKLAAPVYARHKWTWSVRDGKSVPPYIPTEADIRRTLGMLVDSVHKNGSGFSRSGRLAVEKGEMEELVYFLEIGWDE